MSLGKQVKAEGIVKIWGRFRYLWNSVAFYIQIMQFGSVLLLVFNDSLRDWLRNTLGVSVPFGVFMATIFILLMGMIVFEHKYTIPGSQKYAGEQFIKHSPFHDMQTQIEAIAKDQQKIKEQLGIKD
uniref:Uncharacterized protein n=1 Tax=viral metagenome TaxID=1070528 RepID=A0A6M3KVI1_9ZZZZ